MNDDTLHSFQGLPSPSAIPNKKEHLQKPPDGVGTWISARFVMAYLAFLGITNVYTMRVNLNVAILSMVNSSYLESKSHNSTECPGHITYNNQTVENGEFNWDANTRGLVLGAFYYGYIVTQIPGGYLAGRYGGKLLFGLGILSTAVMTLVTPIAAEISFSLFITIRVLQGIFEGVTFPAVLSMLGAWSPPIERSRLLSIILSGPSFGIVLSQPLSGLLCASHAMGGWPSTFYVFGGVAIVWCCLWFLLAANYPHDFKWISQEELMYIESNIQPMLCSKPVWAIFFASFCCNWASYTLVTGLPLYLKQVLNYDVTQDGFISALPALMTWISMNISSNVADRLRANGSLTTTQTRKIFTVISFVGPGIFVTASGFIGCDNFLAVSFICIGTFCGGCAISGYAANQIDIASRYTGILMGISNTMGSIPGFLCPLVIGFLTESDPSRQNWLYVFYISGGINLIGAVVYVLLSSAVEQDWNRIENDQDKVEEAKGLIINNSLVCEVNQLHSDT